MSIKKDINTDIETVLVSNAPFEYAHLIKFERPNAPDNLKFRTNANRFAYFTDASRDISFNDGSTDQDGNSNGSQIYRANRLKSVGSYSETIQAKATTMNLVLGAENINTSVSITGTLASAGSFSYTSGFSTEVFDFVEQGFREGDLISISRNDGTAIGDGTNTTLSAKYIIEGFSNSNQTISLARTGNDTTADFFDIGFPQSNIATAFTITLESEEIRGILSVESADLASPTFFNREVFVYKVFIDPETGNLHGAGDNNSINGILTFKGIITGCSLNEKSTGSTVTWALTSHWGDFNEVKGRITSDSSHRGLNAAEEPNPRQALRPLHATDLGFLHAETSIQALAEYQRVEQRKEYKLHEYKKGWLRKRKYRMEEITVNETIDEKVNLDFGLKAQSIPLIYGVRKIQGIPLFADTDKTDPKKVFAIYALAEGEIHGLFNTHIDGVSVMCIDETDFGTRNFNTGTNKDETKMVCFGRMSQGDTIGGLPVGFVNTAVQEAEYDDSQHPPAKTETSSYRIDTGIRQIGLNSYTYSPFYFSLPSSANIVHTIESSTFDLTPSTLGAAKGLQSDEHTNFKDLYGNQFNMGVTFMRGSPDQTALDKFVVKAKQNEFKRQSDYYQNSTTSVPYWSPQHRLLDTAYVGVEYNIQEDMTEIPEMEYTIKGKVYENYNYDNTYMPINLTGSDPGYYENETVNVSISFDGGNSYELAKTAAGSTQFRILDKYKMTNRYGEEYYRFRLDRTPFYRNNGSTLLSPNGRPTFDHIKISKTSGITPDFVMLPWNAGAYTTPTAFPSQKVNITSVGTSNGKLTVTVAALGNLAGATQVQLVSQTAGASLPADLSGFEFGAQLVTTSGTTLTFKNSNNFSSVTASGVAVQRSRIFDFSSVSGFSSLVSADVVGQFLKIIETGEEREITALNESTNKITISSPFIYTPDTHNTFTISGKGRDLRAGNNPAMQLLDYMTNNIYGKGLDLEEDIDLSSFISSAKLCDTRSDVSIKLTGGTPVVGNRYVFNPSGLTQCNPTFTGKVSAFDSANNVVTFTECTGKLFYEYNNYRTYEKGDLIRSDNYTGIGTTGGKFHSYVNNTPGTLSQDPGVSGAITGTTAFVTNVNSGSALTLTDGTVTLTFDKNSLPDYSIYDADFIKYWRYMGWEHHHQRWATRHQTNFVIDTGASVFSNVNEILSHFNGNLSYENGKYTLGVETQESTPTSTNSFNGTTYNENVNPYYIEKSDIIGDIKLIDNTNKVAKNVVKAAIPDPSINYDNRTITFLNSNFLEADRNVRKTGNLKFGGITNYYNGRINAERHLIESRFGKEITFRVGQKGLLLKAGQVINLNYEPFKFTNKLFRITDLNFQADCTVTIKAVEYDDSAYAITAQRKNLVYSQDTGIDTTLKAPGSPTNLTVSTTQSGYFAIAWDNASDFIEATDSTEVFAATSNNRTNATLIATVDNTTSVEFLIGEFGNRFFWIRHKRVHRSSGNVQKVLRGAYVPSSATGGQQGVSKLMNPSFGFDVGASFVKFDAAGALNPSGTDQDTTFTVVKRGLTGTPTIQLLDADGTTRSGNSAFTDGSQSISGNSATVDASTFVSSDTPKIVKATLTEGGETFTVIASIGIIKEGADGTVGTRTTTGLVYYNAGSQNAPAGPDANNDATFTFATSAFTGLDSGWQTTPPTTNPQDTDAKYWVASFSAVENSAAAGTSSGSNLTFGTPQTFINFTGVVTFTSNFNPTVTVISGQNVTTGTIQSANYTESGGSATAGTKIDLNTGLIRSKEFSIDTAGNANFSGDLSAATGTFAGTVSASAVVAATIDGDKIDVNTLNADRIETNTLDVQGKAIAGKTGVVAGETGSYQVPNSQTFTGYFYASQSPYWGIGGLMAVSNVTNLVYPNAASLIANEGNVSYFLLTNYNQIWYYLSNGTVNRLISPIAVTVPPNTDTSRKATYIMKAHTTAAGRAFLRLTSTMFTAIGWATQGNLTSHLQSPFYNSSTGAYNFDHINFFEFSNNSEGALVPPLPVTGVFEIEPNATTDKTVYFYIFSSIFGMNLITSEPNTTNNGGGPFINFAYTIEGIFR